MNANAPHFDPSGHEQQTYPDSTYYGSDPNILSCDGAFGANYEGEYYDATAVADDATYYHDPAYADPSFAATAPEIAGCFYPHPTSPFGLTRCVFGDPVTAMAFDTSFAAIYVGSTTQSMAGRGSSRAAMLATLSTTDGSLFASVAGHPEAPSACLSRIYASLYGSTGAIGTSTTSTRRHIPNHAYRPPYGSLVQTTATTTTASHAGIQSLVALSGYVASVSPAAVRLHATGGLQVADWDVTGMLTGTAHTGGNSRNSPTTLMTVGGLAEKSTTNGGSTRKALYCVDLYQGLYTVCTGMLDTTVAGDCSVTALESSAKGSIVAGCSDGLVRLFDSRNLRSLAKIKSHAGGVVHVAVSDDGNLVATTGYGVAGTCAAPSYYGYPDPTVLLYDIRYLGRGGFAHAFAGMRGGPRYLSFVPAVNDVPRNRLLVASGQAGGGIQIMYPFQQEKTPDTSDFLLPTLERSETVTSLRVAEQGDTCSLSLGTSQGRILQYHMAGSTTTTSSITSSGVFMPSRPPGGSLSLAKSVSFRPNTMEKEPLVMPPFHPAPPPISLQASLLESDDPNIRRGSTDRMRSILTTYVLTTTPSVSSLGDPRNEASTTFGRLATKPLVAPSRLEVSPKLLAKVDQTIDFLQTVPTADLGLDLLQDHRTTQSKSNATTKKDGSTRPNPNKLLYSGNLFNMAYSESLNRRSTAKGSGNRIRDSRADFGDEEDAIVIPARYRLTLRPSHKSAASGYHADFNQTDFLPGWDYPPTMPNAFVPPVLVLMYFIPELRALASSTPLSERPPMDANLLPELELLFHRIESIASFGTLFPTEGAAMTRICAWAPASFVTFLSTMREAEQLQILDGSPEAVVTARRPEAFFRFMLYQLDKETNKNAIASAPRILDTLSGISFTSVNEFISGSGPPSHSSTRAMTLDMIYDPFLIETKERSKSCFGDVLQYNLCREKKLRAWNQKSGFYETIIQRKIATSLPTVLSLSCACAGRKESEGLGLWRTIENDIHWLPEIFEVELEDDGLVVARELIVNVQTGAETWRECRGTGAIPSTVSELIRANRDSSGPIKRKYQLDAIVSMVRDDVDRNRPEEMRHDDGQPAGHHVLHIRVPNATKRMLLQRQEKQLSKYLSARNMDSISDMTIIGLTADKRVLQQRLDHTKDGLAALGNESSSSWVLMNGFAVSESDVEDARAFHVRFKEPSLVVFRAMDGTDTASSPSQPASVTLSFDVMKTLSITNGSKPPYAVNQRQALLPGKGDLVALDAEFVSVQDEESNLSETGSKLTIRETRHALARLSVLNCSDRSIIFDDHVLPREPVVDYLTRFSGIVAGDLDPKQSPHHLITYRSAYLKLRYLLERGCVFVGHGLQQDFWMANLAVPCSQVIDTVEIYHLPSQKRHISLRFLTNFVLKRDMQQDVHDSVEDAMAAYDLYVRAVELKKQGEFDKLLNDLYEYGRKSDWKLGMED
jgi:PAB-dependent poly(A)-specific ribonuclease subunit 2